jgi:hypothetical protein
MRAELGIQKARHMNSMNRESHPILEENDGLPPPQGSLEIFSKKCAKVIEALGRITTAHFDRPYLERMCRRTLYEAVASFGELSREACYSLTLSYPQSVPFKADSKCCLAGCFIELATYESP